ncbi:MAG: class I SAM-dependent methyltransferase [Acidobacteria bacterium]|nr:class I SAM-dependent methyltransferase [Acidobacteriota bacterium]
MPTDEGRALYDIGRAQVRGGTWLEVGAWCGKSAVFLGAAAQERDCVLFSLDHHHGSLENQRGWEHFDEELVDPVDGRLNTLPHWQRTVAAARLEDVVMGLVGPSVVVAQHFDQPLDLLFIDGGHASEVAWADYRAWTPKVTTGGSLLIHDVFADPADGGRPPYEIYLAALASGEFRERAHHGSLRWLQRG